MARKSVFPDHPASLFSCKSNTQVIDMAEIYYRVFCLMHTLVPLSIGKCTHTHTLQLYGSDWNLLHTALRELVWASMRTWENKYLHLPKS